MQTNMAYSIAAEESKEIKNLRKNSGSANIREKNDWMLQFAG